MPILRIRAGHVLTFAAALTAGATMTGATWAGTPAGSTRWVKICEADSGKQVCTTMQRIVGPSGDLVASVSVRQTSGSAKVQFVVSMPLGLSITSGLSIAIDDKVKLPLKFSICLPAGCYAEGTSDQALVNALKSSGRLVLVAESRGKAIALPVTLTGFTKAYDGKGVDVATARTQFAELAKVDMAAAQARLAKLKETKATDSD